MSAKDRIRQELPKPEVTEAACGTETDGELQNSGPDSAAERKGGGK